MQSAGFDLVLNTDKLHGSIIFHRLDELSHRLVNIRVQAKCMQRVNQGRNVPEQRGLRQKLLRRVRIEVKGSAKSDDWCYGRGEKCRLKRINVRKEYAKAHEFCNREG
jgi:hypothetical protein